MIGNHDGCYPALNVSAIYDSNNNTIAANITVGSQPCGVAYGPAKGEVFVANIDDTTISIVSHGSVATTSTPSTVPEFPPSAVAFIAAGLMAFVGLSSRKLQVKHGG